MELKLNVKKEGLVLSPNEVVDNEEFQLNFGHIFRGENGDGAYESAVEGGYEGTKEEFNASLKDLGKKTNSDGYYPTMSVGMADNLVGRGDVQDAHIGFRPTAGADNITDGAARIERIKGNSVVWNQAVSNADFRNGTEGWGSSLADIYAQDGYMEFVTNEIGSSQFNHYFAKSLTKGHKYIIMCDMERNTTDSYPFCAYFGKRAGGYDTFFGGDYSSDKRHIATAIITATDEIDFMLIYPTINAPADTTTKVYSVQVIDLTHMFGVGNEPTTYEEYLQRKPMNIADEFAYNAGTLVDMKATSLISTSDNAYNPAEKKAYVMPNAKYHITDSANSEYLEVIFSYYDADGSLIFDADFDIVEEDGKTYYLFPQAGWVEVNLAQGDICVCLNHSYDKPHPAYQQDVKDFSFISEAFPEGMRSAGTAYDEIRYNPTIKKWEAVKRIGEVNLGTLNWYVGLGGYYTDGIRQNAKDLFQATCAKYHYVGVYSSVKDKECGYIYLNNVFIKDSSVSDASALKQSLQGVILYYELAEPVITPIEGSENWNMNYLVWDFGTEEAIADGQSVPFRADILYDDNFVDDIRGNKEAIATNKTAIAKNTAAINELQGKVSTNKDPMHDVYLSYYGVSYDEATKLYSVGYLTDLTADDMRKAFAMYGGGIMSAAYNSWISSWGDPGLIKEKMPRTTLPVYASGSRCWFDKIRFSFCWLQLEQISLGFVPSTPNEYNAFKIWQYEGHETQFSFVAMQKLKYIVDPLWCNESHQLDIFETLEQLREVRLLNLQGNVLFSAAANLSKESLLYMINNCASGVSFTITLHPDVYAKCIEESGGEWGGEIANAVYNADINKGTTVILASA